MTRYFKNSSDLFNLTDLAKYIMRNCDVIELSVFSKMKSKQASPNYLVIKIPQY